MLCTGTPRPSTADAGRNWDRLASSPGVTRMHAPAARDIELLGRGVGKACVVVDALLGTGVRGALRDPIRSAVILANRARSEGVPILAVDTPTAVDLTSGEASRPGGPGRRHGDVPPAEGRAPAADGTCPRGTRARGADRHSTGGGPWLTGRTTMTVADPAAEPANAPGWRRGADRRRGRGRRRSGPGDPDERPARPRSRTSSSRPRWRSSSWSSARSDCCSGWPAARRRACEPHHAAGAVHPQNRADHQRLARPINSADFPLYTRWNWSRTLPPVTSRVGSATTEQRS